MINQEFVHTVVNFFNRGDWSPTQGEYFDYEEKKCCATGAYALSKGFQQSEKAFQGYATICEFLNLPVHFIYGVVRGFDDCQHNEHEPRTQEFLDGRETGEHLRSILL